jgi:putative solute:sodium symporter small subunit
MPAMSDAAGQRLWHQTRQLTAGLLLAWLVVSLAGAWFARGLNSVSMLGFPLGFWIAAQGALLAFLLIVVVYAVCMDHLEARYQAERDACDAAAPGAGPGPQ